MVMVPLNIMGNRKLVTEFDASLKLLSKLEVSLILIKIYKFLVL
jgi:hypothetical protein